MAPSSNKLMEINTAEIMAECSIRVFCISVRSIRVVDKNW